MYFYSGPMGKENILSAVVQQHFLRMLRQICPMESAELQQAASGWLAVQGPSLRNLLYLSAQAVGSKWS